MPRASREFLLALLFAACVPLPVAAHPDHSVAHDGWAGFLHPLTGIDHLLAMFAVGLWAARLGRGAMWTLPAVFAFAMVIGAVLALSSIVLPAIEPMIAISVIALGTLVAAGVRLSLLAGALLVAAFAVFHGYAHATEAPSAGATASYALGFVSATVVLHALPVLDRKSVV